MLRRVVFDPTFGGFVGEIPPDSNRDWLKTPEFRMPFGYWRMQLNARRDVFLGYCSDGGESDIGPIVRVVSGFISAL